MASKLSMSRLPIFIQGFLKNEEVLGYSKGQGHLLLALGFGCFNEKIMGNRINSVNTSHFFRERASRDWGRGGGGGDKPCPNSLETKITDISDENFSMSQIFGLSKIIIFKNLGGLPKLWVSLFLSTLWYV